jgi:small-conductance mechanosensitive channel
MLGRYLSILALLLAGSQTVGPSIPVPEIAAEAIQLNQRLQSLPDRLPSEESFTGLEQQIRHLETMTREKQQQTESIIQAGAIFNDLQQASLEWENVRKKVETLSGTLTRDATSLEQDLQSLREQSARWQQTNKVIKTQKSPSELLTITGKAVSDINSALSSVEEQRKRVAALQQTVATQGAIVAAEIEHLKKAIEESQRSLLRRDSLPLWKVQFDRQAESVAQPWRITYADDFQRLKNFIGANRSGFALVITITLVGLILFLHMRRTGATIPSIPQRPFALALLVFIVGMLPLLYRAPDIAIGLISLIGIIPVVRLLKPRLTTAHQRMLSALIVSTVSWHVIRSFHFAAWIKRDLIAVFEIGVIGCFAFFLYQSARDSRQAQRGSWTDVVIYAGILLLFLSLLGNIFGYVGLSHLLGQALLTSAYRGIIYYTLAIAGGVFIAVALRQDATQQLANAVSDRGRLARRLTFALNVILLFVWIHSTLNLFTIQAEVYSAIRAVLAYTIEIGSVRFAVGNIVAFVLTLGVGYLIASLTRAILGEEILPRLKLTYGLPNAIATVTHYVVLVLVFLLALAAAGVELSKFTILTGALGVGLGFGLQNVVNNFVSGLILLFERPIRVGDVLEIGNRTGKVRKIGVRSSTLQSPDGADVIVPNATLISDQVVNWTLSHTRRRIILNIPVAYGNDPTSVRDLLRTTVSTHSGVLNFPNPSVLFLGFGESALNFEVRFWAPSPEVVPELMSEVALGIATALSKAGIKIPVPERALHVDVDDQSEMKKRLAG